MKSPISICLAASLAILGSMPGKLSATNVGTGLIEQLAYLGNASQPDRIPLAPAISQSNYGYGTYGLITESRPSYHGHFSGGARPEYEQNLAVLFGISFEFSDPTQLPGTTLTIRLKPCKPPENAPYSQEQVMAAALQVVVARAYGLSKEGPLSVVIVGDGMPTPEWAAVYAKGYFPEKSGEEARPISIPGVKLEEDARGVRSMVFPGVLANPSIKRRGPVFVPFTFEGESENEGISLIPVWHGDAWTEPLNVLITPQLPYYERWNGYQESPESIAVPHQTPPNPLLEKWKLHVNRTATGTAVSPIYQDFTATQLATLIYACVATLQPTAECPLVFSLSNSTVSEEYRELLKRDPAWIDGTSCEFVLDPSTLKLLKGSVPEIGMKVRYGRLVVIPEASIRESDPPIPKWLEPALQFIRDKAPQTTAEDLTAAKQQPESLLRDPDPDWTKEDEQRVLKLLALHQSDGGAEALQRIWRQSTDRTTRAIAAGLLPTKELEEACWEMEDWERSRRMQEMGFAIRDALFNARKDREKRQ